MALSGWFTSTLRARLDTFRLNAAVAAKISVADLI